MCGILAVVRKAHGQVDLPACRRALSSLSWRGPDLCVSSTWEDRVFLGQTVLSLTGDIQDASGGHARSESGRYLVAYNGEIYNYRALADRWLDGCARLPEHPTDTQVLANLHEVMSADEVPRHLDGMFAYGLLDRHEPSLSFCRDLQGEKSLYIFEDAEQVIVASEIPAILSLVAAPPLDVQSLRDYFRTRHFMQASRTAYRGIRQLLPGQIARFDLQTRQWTAAPRRLLRDWIDPARLEANARRSIDSLTDELDELLTRCVKDMLPDRRRYAAVVSGGVDSSLIGRYLVNEGSPDMLVAVDHVGKDRISSDLSGFERVLGRSIDVLRVDHVPYAAEIVRCQHPCGGPLPSHSFVPQSLQSARVRSAGCRALFGGEGGDEVFGGYDAYLKPIAIGSTYSPSPYTTHYEPEVLFEEDDPRAIQTELHDVWCEALSAYAAVEDERDRAVLAMMYADTAHQLACVGLRGADLMSMMWSVETRTVLVRKPILEFALNLPVHAKIDPAASNPNLRTKVLLKKLFLRHYPAALLVEKQGFAGFPNESAAYLGAPEDYLAFDTMRVVPRDAGAEPYGRATSWKLANVEYFLRSRR